MATKSKFTDEQYKALADELRIKMTPYIPHAPHATQHAFLWLNHVLEVFYGGSAGGGKACVIYTPIATPSGWTTMGDLKLGDFVFGADGYPTKVVACSEVHYEDCYRMVFDDGSEIIAGERHRWKTESYQERLQNRRRSSAGRAARRSTRASHTTVSKVNAPPGICRCGCGNPTHIIPSSNARLCRVKGEYYEYLRGHAPASPAQRRVVAQRNRRDAVQNRKNGLLMRPTGGTIRETHEIADTLYVREDRINHSITNTEPLQLPEQDLLIDPYVLGAWLGDGSTNGGQVCLYEQELYDNILNCGYTLTPKDEWGTHTVYGIGPHLRKMKLLGDKRIPISYLRASYNQRVALLQGMMDTDGSASATGQCSYTTVLPILARDFRDLLRTFGIKATVSKNKSPLYGVRKKDRYRFKFTTDIPAFRLQRKLDRQKKQSNWRGTQDRRYIVSCERTADVPLRCIQVEAKDGMFLAGRQMVPTHNSDALLMSALQYVDVPGYNAILFRKTYADLSLPGSLIPRSQEWLSGTDASWNDNDAKWTFPSGATLSFGYMRNEDDRMRYRSAEFHGIFFDELTTFTELQYTYMFSRLRKPKDLTKRNPLAQVPLRMRAASNPGDRGHLWVKKRFIDPVGKRSNEPEDPTQRIYLPARLADNPSVDAESYLAALAQMDEASQAQLIEGDWDAREPGQWVIPDPTSIQAAVALGQELWDSEKPIPRDNKRDMVFGIDWGEFTHFYIILPMPNGGVYVLPSEVIGEHDDAASVGLKALKMAERMGLQHDITIARYDAAGIQNMRTFAKTARAREGWERLRAQKIAFAKYKKESMNYLRLLFKRTALGKSDRIIAIHPANETLISQLHSWKRKSEESEDVEKVNDHGCDALIAGIAPIAFEHRAYIEDMIQKAKEMKKREQK